MKRFLFGLLVCSLFANSVYATTAYDGLKNPDPARSLDPAYVASMFHAAFVYFNQQHPGTIPEADEGYWLSAFWSKNPPANPQGIGWDGYWWDRVENGAGIPGTISNPVPTPLPIPGPIVPTPSTIDYGPALQKILDSQVQLLTAQQDLLAVGKDIAVVVKDTNTHVRNIDKTFGQTIGQISAFVGKYIAPAAVAWLAGSGKL